MAKKDYTNWDKKDLIKEIEQLRKRKKYGLVWEDKPENVVEQCKTELPVLEEVKSKEIITAPDKPVNLLIEGDNYHALSVLNYTHKGKIDVIYIDPPYNTGNKDFVYNDQYVDKEDAYRHSKWVSFMSKRLELAKSLLSKDGIIFISIDDNELAQLKLLCDEIFSENNFVSLNVVESGEVFGTKAAHADKTFVKVKDYVLVYTKNKGALKNKQPLYDATRELYDPHFGTIIEEDLSKDLSKMMPFALLGVFLIDISYFSITDSLETIIQLPILWKLIVYYLIALIIIEFVLRVLYLLFGGNEIEEQNGKGK